MHSFFLILKSLIFNPQSFELRSKGMSSVYIIIIIITLTFAIMLAGGSGSLFTGNIGSPALPTPTIDPTAPTAIPTTTSWIIGVKIDSCNKGRNAFVLATAAVIGMAKGYVQLEIGSEIIGTQEFTPPTKNFPLTLSNKEEFNSKPWKFSVFEGGSFVDGQWSGGTIRKTYDGVPTECT